MDTRNPQERILQVARPPEFRSGVPTQAALPRKRHGFIQSTSLVKDALPWRAVQKYSASPVLTESTLHCLMGVTRKQVEAGEFQLAVAMTPTFDGDNFLRHCFAWRKGYLLLDIGILPSEHWALDRARWMDEEYAAIDVLGPKVRGEFIGEFVQGDVTYCEAYDITVGREAVRIDDSPIFIPGTGFVVPLGAEDPGLAVEMCSSFEDHEDAIEYERENFGLYLGRLRAMIHG